MQSVTKQTLKIYGQHAWRYKGSVVFLAIGDIVTCGLDLYMPFLVKQIINALTVNNSDLAIRYIWYFSAAYLVNQLFWRSLGYVNSYFQPRVMADLLNTCYEYLLGHAYSFFADNFTGSIVTRVRRYRNSFERLADVITWEVFRTVIKVISIMFILGYLWPFMGAVTLAWSALYVALAYSFTQWKLPLDIQTAEQDTKTTAHLADTLTNSINLKLFTSRKPEIRSFRSITERLFRLQKKNWTMGQHFEAFQGIAFVLLNLAVMLLGIHYWRAGVFNAGDFGVLFLYMSQMNDRLWDFGKNLRSIYESLADANEMTLMLMEKHKIVDKPEAKALVVKQGEIVFDNVSFFYSPNNPIFKHFNLRITPGARIAFVGPSGAGKSTIIKLLLRFEDVTKGQIRIDDQDIASVTQDSLRQAIAFVPQEPILFHRSLMDNIRYGRPTATDKEVMAAAKLAHAHEFISSFPDKYDTFVGERGVKLSGGERQRVAIARAILKDAPILILDEATSSLDSESESFIQEALHNLMQGRTTIAVAHRLSTIRDADRIIVIEDGNIIEEGKHEELMKARSGMYQKLWDIQVGGFETVVSK